MDRKYEKILGVDCDSTTISLVLSKVSKLVQNRHKFYIVTPNPEIVLKAQKDRELMSALNKADIKIPDGIGIIWANFVLNGRFSLTRIKGRELFVELLALSDQKNLRVFILGGRERVNKLTVEKIKQEYQNIIIQGESGPWLDNEANPVSESDTKKQKDTLDKINSFKPDLLFVAFGAPKQEKWIAKNMKKLNFKGAMTVGGALDYYSGFAPLPPKIFASLGLEWLWRLVFDPKRFGRILSAVVIFPLVVIKRKILG